MIVEEIIARHDNPIKTILEPSSFKKKEKLAIYGVGQGYYTFRNFVLDKFKIDVELYIDLKFGASDKFNDSKAVHPNNLCDLNLHEFNMIVTNEKSKFNSIKNQLQKYFNLDIYSTFEFYEYHVSYADKSVVYDGYNYYLNRKNEIESAYLKLCDTESKIVFEQVLELYMTREIKNILHHDISEQYLSPDVGNIDYSRMISCGAFDGDTIKYIYDTKGKLEKILVFEPDLKNFTILSEFLNEAADTLGQSVSALPLAVGNKLGYKKMSEHGKNSSLLVGGNMPVHKVALDDIIKTNDYCFINMDIEGGEFEALKGAESYLKRCRPSLAISIYHQPKDLWRICIYLRDLNLNYNFFIRNYTGYPAETILYATTTDSF